MAQGNSVNGRGGSGDVAARCAGVAKCYGQVKALDGLDLEVRRGECFGLLGPNGAGKTTTVEILEGLLTADSGSVEVLGHSWGSPGGDRAVRDRIGVQLQEARFAEKLTVYETVRLFRSFHIEGIDPDDAIGEVELEEKRDARVGRLSGGQRQRLALACALVGSPDLLFLDEPTTGLDPQARHHLWEHIRRFRARGGTALLTTHYMEEAAHLCDRVAVMDRGRVVASGRPADLVAALGAAQIVEFTCQCGGDHPQTRQTSATGQLIEGAGVPAEISMGLLKGLEGVADARVREGAVRLTVRDIGVALPALLSAMRDLGLRLGRLTTHQPTLEDVFIHLTGRELRDG